MRVFPLGLCALAAGISPLATASPVTLFEQYSSSPTFETSFFSDAQYPALSGTSTVVQRIADNFVLSALSSVSQVTFDGVYGTPFVSDFIDATPSGTLTIEIYSDAPGLPGASIHTETIDFATVTHSPTGRPVPAFSVTERTFTADFASDVVLGPGTYWLSVFVDDGDPSTFFAWSASADLGDLNDGLFAFNTDGSDAYMPGDSAFDFVFAVNGTAGTIIPIPSAAALGLVGLGGLAALRRRAV